MSLPLPEITKIRITFETKAWLDKECQVRSARQRRTVSASEVVREVLHAHVQNEIHDAKLLLAHLKSTCLTGDERGGDESA